jgi:tetratricopeptide (TPR) repeat protein
MKILFKILLFIYLGIVLIPISSYSQEFTLKETEEKKEKTEEKKYLDFQNHFFEALHQKSREDYNKAIESLDECNAIYPENDALNFEYAKNYLHLKDYENAIFFVEKAMKVKPNNIHLLEHLKETYRLQKDYKNAIIIQKKMVSLKPSKEDYLIFLYILNRQNDKAKLTYKKVERLGLIGHRKNYYKRILFPEIRKKEIVTKNTVKSTTTNAVTINTEKEAFQTDKSYKFLIKLLKTEEFANKYDLVLKHSNEGLSLFPAQPNLYLINSRALNKLNKYKEALSSLELGLDFIIDDNNLLANFYEQMQIAYLGLGQQINATKYQKKALSLRQSD